MATVDCCTISMSRLMYSNSSYQCSILTFPQQRNQNFVKSCPIKTQRRNSFTIKKTQIEQHQTYRNVCKLCLVSMNGSCVDLLTASNAARMLRLPPMAIHLSSTDTVFFSLCSLVFSSLVCFAFTLKQIARRQAAIVVDIYPRIE